MTKYTLTIDYETGSTFGSKIISGKSTDLVFDNAQLAADAAELIEEHYRFVEDHDREIHRFSKQKAKKLKKKCINSDWYQNYIKAGGGREYENDWVMLSYRIGGEVSPGVFKAIYPFWQGFFETLINVNIVKAND